MGERIPKDYCSEDWAEVSKMSSLLNYCLADMMPSQRKTAKSLVPGCDHLASFQSTFTSCKSNYHISQYKNRMLPCVLLLLTHKDQNRQNFRAVCPTGLLATVFIPGVSPGALGDRFPATASTMISMFPVSSSVVVASTSRQPGAAGKGVGFPVGQGLWTGSRIPGSERGGGISNSSEHSPSIPSVLLAGCESSTGSVITTNLSAVVLEVLINQLEVKPNKI